METTMTRNGQITIPKEYREYFGLKEGSKLFVGPAEGGLLLRPARKYPWDLPGESGFTDEIVRELETIRKETGRYP